MLWVHSLFARIMLTIYTRNISQRFPHQMRLHIASCQATVIQQISIPNRNSLHVGILHCIPILDAQARRVVVPDLMYISILVIVPKVRWKRLYIPFATCIGPGHENVLDCGVGDLTACSITAVNTSERHLLDETCAIVGVKFYTGVVVAVPW